LGEFKLRVTVMIGVYDFSRSHLAAKVGLLPRGGAHGIALNFMCS
jgi:hypothetical protein